MPQQFGPLSYISSDQRTLFHPQSNGFIEDWNGQLKHWLSKTRRDKSLKSWLTHFHECVLTHNMNMSGAKEMSPLNKFSDFLVNLGKGEWGKCYYAFFPISPELFFLFSPYSMHWTQDQG